VANGSVETLRSETAKWPGLSEQVLAGLRCLACQNKLQQGFDGLSCLSCGKYRSRPKAVGVGFCRTPATFLHLLFLANIR
jgi:hypothetical protein